MKFSFRKYSNWCKKHSQSIDCWARYCDNQFVDISGTDTFGWCLGTDGHLWMVSKLWCERR